MAASPELSRFIKTHIDLAPLFDDSTGFRMFFREEFSGSPFASSSSFEGSSSSSSSSSSSYLEWQRSTEAKWLGLTSALRHEYDVRAAQKKAANRTELVSQQSLLQSEYELFYANPEEIPRPNLKQDSLRRKRPRSSFNSMDAQEKSGSAFLEASLPIEPATSPQPFFHVFQASRSDYLSRLAEEEPCCPVPPLRCFVDISDRWAYVTTTDVVVLESVGTPSRWFVEPLSRQMLVESGISLSEPHHHSDDGFSWSGDCQRHGQESTEKDLAVDRVRQQFRLWISLDRARAIKVLRGTRLAIAIELDLLSRLPDDIISYLFSGGFIDIHSFMVMSSVSHHWRRITQVPSHAKDVFQNHGFLPQSVQRANSFSLQHSNRIYLSYFNKLRCVLNCLRFRGGEGHFVTFPHLGSLLFHLWSEKVASNFDPCSPGYVPFSGSREKPDRFLEHSFNLPLELIAWGSDGNRWKTVSKLLEPDERESDDCMELYDGDSRPERSVKFLAEAAEDRILWAFWEHVDQNSALYGIAAEQSLQNTRQTSSLDSSSSTAYWMIYDAPEFADAKPPLLTFLLRRILDYGLNPDPLCQWILRHRICGPEELARYLQSASQYRDPSSYEERVVRGAWVK